MSLRNWTVNCDVCGGEGFGTLRTAAAEWDPDARVFHTDPRICRDNLRLERERLESEKKIAEGQS